MVQWEENYRNLYMKFHSPKVSSSEGWAHNWRNAQIDWEVCERIFFFVVAKFLFFFFFYCLFNYLPPCWAPQIALMFCIFFPLCHRLILEISSKAHTNVCGLGVCVWRWIGQEGKKGANQLEIFPVISFFADEHLFFLSPIFTHIFFVAPSSVANSYTKCNSHGCVSREATNLQDYSENL